MTHWIQLLASKAKKEPKKQLKREKELGTLKNVTAWAAKMTHEHPPMRTWEAGLKIRIFTGLRIPWDIKLVLHSSKHGSAIQVIE
jgi:hypothetical protein